MGPDLVLRFDIVSRTSRFMGRVLAIEGLSALLGG